MNTIYLSFSCSFVFLSFCLFPVVLSCFKTQLLVFLITLLLTNGLLQHFSAVLSLFTLKKQFVKWTFAVLNWFSLKNNYVNYKSTFYCSFESFYFQIQLFEMFWVFLRCLQKPFFIFSCSFELLIDWNSCYQQICLFFFYFKVVGTNCLQTASFHS